MTKSEISGGEVEAISDALKNLRRVVLAGCVVAGDSPQADEQRMLVTRAAGCVDEAIDILSAARIIAATTDTPNQEDTQ